MCGACIVFFILLSVLYFGIKLCFCRIVVMCVYIFVVQVAIIYYILHARETEFKIHWLL